MRPPTAARATRGRLATLWARSPLPACSWPPHPGRSWRVPTGPAHRGGRGVPGVRRAHARPAAGPARRRRERRDHRTRGGRHRRDPLRGARAAPSRPAGRGGARRAAARAGERRRPALDFPPADSGYHNYAELTAEVNAVVAAHPTIASRFSARHLAPGPRPDRGEDQRQRGHRRGRAGGAVHPPPARPRAPHRRDGASTCCTCSPTATAPTPGSPAWSTAGRSGSCRTSTPTAASTTSPPARTGPGARTASPTRAPAASAPT